jgi:iron complex transport system ATP-binding protein
MSGSALLRAADVSFAYEAEPVLRDVSLDVARGSIVGILGPNGSGKSTLLRLLAGTLVPSRGRVELDGAEIRRLSRGEVARRVAVVPQETQLAFDYTVLEIALMGRYPHLGRFEIEGPADLTIATDALGVTGTAHLANRAFRTLSGGEKQRAIIASALAQLDASHAGVPATPAPRALLLDEPTAALDLGYQLDVAAILRDLTAARGLTIVVATHDLNFAASLCTHLLLLREGRVQAWGATRDVLTAAEVAALYGVAADVRFDARTGHVTVVPIERLPLARPPR